MTRVLFVGWLIVAFAFGALGMSIVLIHPAFAAEPVGFCYNEAQLEIDTKNVGGKIVGGASYDGDVTDQMVIVQGLKDILFFGFKDGCLILSAKVEPAAKPDGAA